MKLFHFYRKDDHSGVSGTGPVVEGVEFTNGWCALRWMSGMSSMCFYQSLSEVEAIHGHNGKTELIVHDFEPLKSRRAASGSNSRFEILLNLIEQASHLVTMAEEDGEEAAFQKLLTTIRSQVDQLEESVKAKDRKAG